MFAADYLLDDEAIVERLNCYQSFFQAPQSLHVMLQHTHNRCACCPYVENGNVYDKFRVDKSYLARIPAGAYDGMKLRLQGAGKPKEAGGSGNVLVTVKVNGS